jgi:hypothetical protein
LKFVGNLGLIDESMKNMKKKGEEDEKISNEEE